MTTIAKQRRTTWTVEVQLNEFISDHPFEDILAAINSGLGHPNFGEFIRRIGAIPG